MSESSIRRRVVVGGQVQGVFFRDSARQRAERHGVAGWVRNCADGTVEALLEGERAAVEAVIAFLHEGPPRARVEHIEVSEAPTGEPLSGFNVR